MEFDKSQILSLLRSRGDHSTAEQADRELPDTVDTDQHSDQLSKFGLNPGELIGKLTGGDGPAGGLGGLLGR